MRDPRWCDGWSNVNGVRHPLAAQFWGEANAGEGGGGQPQNARGRAPIAIPPPCAIPLHHRALRILQLPRLLLLGAFQARAGQTRETQDGRSRCSADGPKPSSDPHQQTLIASASFGGTVHQQKLKAWLKKAQKRRNFFKRPPQACEQ